MQKIHKLNAEELKQLLANHFEERGKTSLRPQFTLKPMQIGSFTAFAVVLLAVEFIVEGDEAKVPEVIKKSFEEA